MALMVASGLPEDSCAGLTTGLARSAYEAKFAGIEP
jgi:hypothetical protein